MTNASVKRRWRDELVHDEGWHADLLRGLGHFANAYDDGDLTIIDLPKHPRMFHTDQNSRRADRDDSAACSVPHGFHGGWAPDKITIVE